MKLLIAYDGSSYSEAALADLARAGLPPEADALVLTVAEVWLPSAPENTFENADYPKLNTPLSSQLYEHRAKSLSEAKALALHAQQRLTINFPNWRTRAKAEYGSPASAIINRGEELGADLIVTGSHGRSMTNPLLPGSTSQKVLSEARSSVRIARGNTEKGQSLAGRIMIGFDGSTGALAAARAVASRNWREKTEVRLVAALDPVIPLGVGRFVSPVVSWVNADRQSERLWIEKLAEEAAQTLRDGGLKAAIHIHTGNPRRVLVEEAEKWGADSIFVGATACGSQTTRFLLGSVSGAVAARAACSVEAVRAKR